MAALRHRLLRQFLAVAEAGTVRAAALALNMSQPPITAAIRSLESDLGVDLFVRSAKGMELTPAGDALAADARAILGALARAEARVREVGGRPGPLRIGFVSAALSRALPELLRTVRARGAQQIELLELTTPEQLVRLTDGTLSIGLLHPPVPRVADLSLRPLGRDPFWAALPEQHPLAARPSVTFADIAGEPFVLFPAAQGPVLHAKIRDAAAVAGHDLRIVAEAGRVHSQLAIVAGGLGIGLVTRETARTLHVRGVRAIPIVDTEKMLFLELSALADPETIARCYA